VEVRVIHTTYVGDIENGRIRVVRAPLPNIRTNALNEAIYTFSIELIIPALNTTSSSLEELIGS
jgi:hypothetical protein